MLQHLDRPKHSLIDVVESKLRKMPSRIKSKALDTIFLNHPPRVAHQQAESILDNGITLQEVARVEVIECDGLAQLGVSY